MGEESQTSMRTMLCGNVQSHDIGTKIVLCGWVAKRRNLGGLLFIDLRDKSGIVQLALDPATADANLYSAAEALRPEWPIMVEGIVRARPKDMVRANMPTGAVEIEVSALTVLNTSETPPFHIEDDVDTAEDLRLRYRYLDMRRPKIQHALSLRNDFTFALRQSLHNMGFLEIETPILGKSTPEGARDFIVPSRMQKNNFYALPQSPQLLKELLMVGGIDRYYQVARCFRDEDLRADRQPEFTQVDLELSFVSQGDVMAAVEKALAPAFQAVGVKFPTPLKQIDYWDAMDTYGSDKPDLRFGMHLVDVEAVFTKSEFQVLARAATDEKQVIRALCAQGAGTWSRSKIDKLQDVAKAHGAQGLVWIALKEDGSIQSPQKKFLSNDEISDLSARLGAQSGDLMLVCSGERLVCDTALGALRLYLADELEIAREGHAFCWVVDFPMFEYDAEEERFSAEHHPFTLPKEEDINLIESNPLRVGSYTYDLVMDGCEAGGGGLRIHDANLQMRVLKRIGMTEEQAQAQFGFLLEALSFGAPPMGGFALGLDRVCMLCAGASSIRDVMAFPKTTSGNDLMMGAPSGVSTAQLTEVGLKSEQ